MKKKNILETKKSGEYNLKVKNQSKETRMKKRKEIISRFKARKTIITMRN